jgi:hypothetical protein
VVAVVLEEITEGVVLVVEDIKEVGRWWCRQLQMW